MIISAREDILTLHGILQRNRTVELHAITTVPGEPHFVTILTDNKSHLTSNYTWESLPVTIVSGGPPIATIIRAEPNIATEPPVANSRAEPAFITFVRSEPSMLLPFAANRLP